MSSARNTDGQCKPTFSAVHSNQCYQHLTKGQRRSSRSLQAPGCYAITWHVYEATCCGTCNFSFVLAPPPLEMRHMGFKQMYEQSGQHVSSITSLVSSPSKQVFWALDALQAGDTSPPLLTGRGVVEWPRRACGGVLSWGVHAYLLGRCFPEQLKRLTGGGSVTNSDRWHRLSSGGGVTATTTRAYRNRGPVCLLQKQRPPAPSRGPLCSTGWYTSDGRGKSSVVFLALQHTPSSLPSTHWHRLPCAAPVWVRVLWMWWCGLCLWGLCGGWCCGALAGGGRAHPRTADPPTLVTLSWIYLLCTCARGQTHTVRCCTAASTTGCMICEVVVGGYRYSHCVSVNSPARIQPRSPTPRPRSSAKPSRSSSSMPLPLPHPLLTARQPRQPPTLRPGRRPSTMPAPRSHPWPPRRLHRAHRWRPRRRR